MSHFELGSGEVGREIVLRVPLPQDPRPAGALARRAHTYRALLLPLGQQLRAFRAQHGLLQTEVAHVVGAGPGSTVSQWETGTKVPDGVRLDAVRQLVQGQLWREIRAAMVAGEGLPESWAQAVRWYRRASRERALRETIGSVVAALLVDLRSIHTCAALRTHYVERNATWLSGRQPLQERPGVERRRIEDAAYGLRWLELVHGRPFDLTCSLVPQLPHGRRTASVPRKLEPDDEVATLMGAEHG